MQFPDLPKRMQSLPLSPKGYPIPFFATDGDFRVITAEKMMEAIQRKRCWICGGKLASKKAFVVGPMFAINRTISEPPSHPDCAVFAAKNCPFMANPAAKRNTRNLPEGSCEAAGLGLKRNPGAVGVWTTRDFKVFSPPGGGVLFSIGDPVDVQWFASGREATRQEVMHSIETGIGHLNSLARAEGPAAVLELAARRSAAMTLLPRDAGAAA